MAVKPKMDVIPKKPAQGIYLRRKTYWLNFRQQGKKYHISLQTRDPVEAVRRAANARQSPDLAPKQFMERDIQSYLDHCRKEEKASETVKWLDTCLKDFRVKTGNPHTTDVTTSMVEKWYRDRLSDHSENGTRSYLRAVKCFFSWAVSERIIRQNPAKLKLKAVRQKCRVKFCERTLRDRLISKCTETDLAIVLHLGFLAGMRKKEIIQLEPDWITIINSERGFITIPFDERFTPKGKKSRQIPMSKKLINFLTSINYRNRRPYVLKPEVKKGRSVYRYDFRAPFETYMSNHGCAWVTPHVMRHTFASIAIISGAPLLKVAKWIGDTLAVCEDYYAHLSPEEKSINKYT